MTVLKPFWDKKTITNLVKYRVSVDWHGGRYSAELEAHHMENARIPQTYPHTLIIRMPDGTTRILFTALTMTAQVKPTELVDKLNVLPAEDYPAGLVKIAYQAAKELQAGDKLKIRGLEELCPWDGEYKTGEVEIRLGNGEQTVWVGENGIEYIIRRQQQLPSKPGLYSGNDKSLYQLDKFHNWHLIYDASLHGNEQWSNPMVCPSEAYLLKRMPLTFIDPLNLGENDDSKTI
ncbi:hypothetical protein [Bifidobacterium callitrichidarum]|uniref:Uncharacterized protein n=1 Tax=Bifidobacterium callitrichidarum TaxID=2052941 RepID=A0A2U2NC14_9BIFI|nr:hypothetical protein [Bifidobacterium callitrichidarum]PWG66628.1 hypothetical protein DF196_01630 [Bifidobacterium callitrichidarum]